MYFSDLYDGTSINTEILRDHLRQEGRLSEELALKIIRDGKRFWLKICNFIENFGPLNRNFKQKEGFNCKCLI